MIIIVSILVGIAIVFPIARGRLLEVERRATLFDPEVKFAQRSTPPTGEDGAALRRLMLVVDETIRVYDPDVGSPSLQKH